MVPIKSYMFNHFYQQYLVPLTLAPRNSVRACVYSERGTEGGPSAVAGVSGRWRVEGGGGRSAVAVFVARRRVCLETRGKHERALSVKPPCVGSDMICTSLLWSFGIAKIKSERCLLFRPSRSERASQQSEHQHCRPGERGPR